MDRMDVDFKGWSENHQAFGKGQYLRQNIVMLTQILAHQPHAEGEPVADTFFGPPVGPSASAYATVGRRGTFMLIRFEFA